MNSSEFIEGLARWIAGQGEAVDTDYEVTTAEEAIAVCEALGSERIFDQVNSIGTPALFSLCSFFQSASSQEAFDVFRHQGIPVIRGILDRSLMQSFSAIDDDTLSGRKKDSLLFAIKILVMYAQKGDGELVIRAARKPEFSNEYLWCVILDNMGNFDHPDALAVCEALKDPLPEEFLGIAYLDFANALAIRGIIPTHPFNTGEGIKRIEAFLTDANPDNYSYAFSAVTSIPFLDEETRDRCLGLADNHPYSMMKLETAWALAKSGFDAGIDRLAMLCLNPRFAVRASAYLAELGSADRIPEKVNEPDYYAMSEMCEWLMHPHEYGRPPDTIELFDKRDLNWPPTNDRRRLWLFRYSYETEGETGQGTGLVGSVTFSLSGEATAELSPEDIYGIHCCWELEINQDPRAPQSRSAKAGRDILGELNPGFA